MRVGRFWGALRAGTVTAIDAARDAHAIRNDLLISMRSRTSPIGLCVAQSLTPAGGEYKFHLDKNAQGRYGKPFVELTTEEPLMVFISPPTLDYQSQMLTR